jgi:hypothetical protein
MIIDPEAWPGTLAAYAEAVELWDTEGDPDGAVLQVDVVLASFLARKLVAGGHRQLDLRKFHARSGPEGDPNDLASDYWHLTRHYRTQ